MKFFVQGTRLSMWDTDVNKTDPCGTWRSTQILGEHVPVRKSPMQYNRCLQDLCEPDFPHPLHTIIKAGVIFQARSTPGRSRQPRVSPGAQSRRVPPSSGAGFSGLTVGAPPPPAGSEEPLTVTLSQAAFPRGPRGRSWGHLEDFSHLPSRPQLFRKYRRVGMGPPAHPNPSLEAPTHGRPARRCPAAPKGGSWLCGCTPACRAVAQVALRRL